jgi:hypothetical protein
MIIAQTSGAIRFLVHILQLDYCPGNDPCKVSAAFAMQNLAYHCSTTRERIAQAGAIPVLIQLLQSLDDSVREASAGETLRHLFWKECRGKDLLCQDIAG